MVLGPGLVEARLPHVAGSELCSSQPSPICCGVALWYQGISYLCRIGMLEDGLVVPRGIMFVLRMEC